MLFALTELVAEIAFWLTKKTAVWSYRGVVWGWRRARDAPGPETLEDTVMKLQRQLEVQQGELDRLKNKESASDRGHAAP